MKLHDKFAKTYKLLLLSVQVILVKSEFILYAQVKQVLYHMCQIQASKERL